MRIIFFLLLTISSFDAGASGFGPLITNEKAKWDSANHPEILVSNPVYDFFALPLSGSLADQANLWSDSYWPRNEGGVSRRWQDLSGSVKYKVLTERAAKAMTKEQIAKLSPAEKFDFLLDDYGFEFTRKIKRQNPLNRPEWEGICHGWAQASIHHKQFSSVTLKNKTGKEISFASSDVAALMSYYYAWVGGGKVKFLGRRCRENAGSTSIKCTDMNAGAFHVVLANSIRDKKSFIMDLDPYKSVWNYPVLGYETKVLEERMPSSQSAPGTVKQLLISTRMWFVQEAGPQWEAPLRVPGYKDYWYWLELDQRNNILGGSWSDNTHPDFAWVSSPAKVSSPYSAFINL